MESLTARSCIANTRHSLTTSHLVFNPKYGVKNVYGRPTDAVVTCDGGSEFGLSRVSVSHQSGYVPKNIPNK